MDNRGVYILKGNRHYVGSTNNIERRLREHRQRKTTTTLKIGNRELKRWISCKTEIEARALEKKIKKGGHYDRRIV